jgi:hypothetical protein
MIASAGHCAAQAPQSKHASASISYWFSPLEIALTGHSASQAPHDKQASVILYAITSSSFFEYPKNLGKHV